MAGRVKQFTLTWVLAVLTSPVWSGGLGNAIVGTPTWTEYSNGQPLSADVLNNHFDAIADAVNDNDARVSVIESLLSQQRVGYVSVNFWGIATPAWQQSDPSGPFVGAYNGTSGLAYVSGLSFMDVSLNLPDLAVIDQLEAYVYDANASFDLMVLINRNDLISGPQFLEPVASVLSSGSIGEQTLTLNLSPTFVVDNENYAYSARIVFDSSVVDGSIGFYRLRIRYVEN